MSAQPQRKVVHTDIKPNTDPALATRFIDVPNMPWEPTKFPGIEIKVLYSDDEGRTWKWTRHLEKQPGSFHYPTIVQAADGALHASYSYFVSGGKSIKHARFNTAWIKQGDSQ